MSGGSARAAPRPAEMASAAHTRMKPDLSRAAPVSAARPPRALSGGRPLPPTTRDRMEASFERPLDDVRVHTDAAGAGVADSHHAEALTVGSHIAFARGRYNPDTLTGARLLAHELAHVAQQGDEHVRPQAAPADPADATERQAEEAAGRAVRGERAAVSPAWTTRGRILRQARRGAEALPLPSLQPELANDPEVADLVQATAQADRRRRRRQAGIAEPPTPESTHLRVVPATAEAEPRTPPRGRLTPVPTALEQAPPAAEIVTRPRDLGRGARAPPPGGEPQPSAALVSSTADASERAAQDRSSATVGAPSGPAAAGAAAGRAPPGAAGLEGVAAEPEAPSAARTSVASPSGETGGAISAVSPTVAETVTATETVRAVAEVGPESSAALETLEPGAAPNALSRSPTSPDEDPGFLATAARTRAAASNEARAQSPVQKAAEAQAAATGPANEREAKAAGAQVEKMDAQPAGVFDRAGFVAALHAKIAEIAPKNLKEMEGFKGSGKMDRATEALSGQVEQGAAAATGAVAQTTAQAPDASAQTAKQTTPLPPAPVGGAPAPIGAEAAVPKPKTESEVSLVKESQGLDTQMSDEGVTEQQFEESNEPEFQSAIDAKHEAQADAAAAPQRYREGEAITLTGAQNEAVGVAGAGLQGLHGERERQLGGVVAHQTEGKGKDEQARAKVASDIQAIYDGAKTSVENRLKKLDEDVDAAFNAGADAAVAAAVDLVDDRITDYKIDRYLSIPVVGQARWIRDQFLDLPDEVNGFYDEGQRLFTSRMDAVIDEVARIVETGLAEAKAEIATGRQQVADYVAGLDESLRDVGQETARSIGSRFDELSANVDARQAELIDTLASRYVEKLGQLNEKLEAIKAANRGLVNKAKDLIAGVIETIKRLKQMILDAAASAAGVIGDIIAHPVRFLSNLISGVKQGLGQFVANIAKHLKEGLLGWLFGTLAAAGVKLPESFDLKGIISMILQTLGITYASFRSRAVRLLGEPIVAALETAAEIFLILVREGPAGLWRYISEQVGNLKDVLLEEIKSWVITKVITAGITWVLSLLNPASAFVRAIKLIIDIVGFFIERGSQILDLVNAIVQSLAEIASGAVGKVANAIESALGRVVPIAISFLASLLGLGGIAGTIQKFIQKLQAPVNKAIDWIIGKVVQIARKMGGLFGGKKKDKRDEAEDPGKTARIERGLAEIDEEDARQLEMGAISHQDAEVVAAKVKRRNPVFQSIIVVDGGETWDYQYEASSAAKKTGAIKKPTPTMPIVKVRPFECDMNFYKLDEFERQVGIQETGINEMDVEKWLSRRAAFAMMGRTGASAVRKVKREKSLLRAQLTLQHGPQAVLHRIDQVAGGGGTEFAQDPIRGEFGDRGINSSIGSQWIQPPSRVGQIEQAAKDVKVIPVAERPHTKMNVDLSVVEWWGP